jgi:hypothetical protein
MLKQLLLTEGCPIANFHFVDVITGKSGETNKKRAESNSQKIRKAVACSISVALVGFFDSAVV